eukprot:tig00000704_g3343.t1
MEEDTHSLQPAWRNFRSIQERTSRGKKVYSREELLRWREGQQPRPGTSSRADDAEVLSWRRESSPTEHERRDADRSADRDRDRSPGGTRAGSDRIRFPAERPRLALKPRSTPTSSVVGAQESPPPREPREKEGGKHPTPQSFYYLDPQGVTQGPFTKGEMAAWHEAGYFTPDLPTRSNLDTVFQRLDELLPHILGKATSPYQPATADKASSSAPAPSAEKPPMQSHAETHDIDELHSKHIENLLHDHEAEEKSRHPAASAWAPAPVDEANMHPGRILGAPPLPILPHTFVPELPPFPAQIPPVQPGFPHIGHIPPFHAGQHGPGAPMFPGAMPPHFGGDVPPHLLALQHLHLQAYLHQLHSMGPPGQMPPQAPPHMPFPQAHTPDPVESVWDLGPEREQALPAPAAGGPPSQLETPPQFEETPGAHVQGVVHDATENIETGDVQDAKRAPAWKVADTRKSTLAEIQAEEEALKKSKIQQAKYSPPSDAALEAAVAIPDAASPGGEENVEDAGSFQKSKSKKKKKPSNSASKVEITAPAKPAPAPVNQSMVPTPKHSVAMPEPRAPSVASPVPIAQVAPPVRTGPVWKAPSIAPARTLQEIQAEEALEQKRRLEEQMRMEAEARDEDRRTTSSSGPWGARPVAAPSLREILMQEKAMASTSSVQSSSSATSVSPAPRVVLAPVRTAKVETVSSSSVWGSAAPSKPKTLADIQAEELESKQRMTQVQHTVPPPTSSLPFSSAWERGAVKAVPVVTPAPPVSSSSPAPSPAIQRAATRAAVSPSVETKKIPDDDDNFWDTPDEPPRMDKTQNKKQASQKGAAPIQQQHQQQDNLALWCERQLRDLRLDIDTETLLSIFSTEMSDGEMRDYLRDILGESLGTRNFAEEFIQRWRLTPIPKAGSPQASSLSGFSTQAKAKGKKGKTKAVPLALSFSVASENRPNRGEIVGSSSSLHP